MVSRYLLLDSGEQYAVQEMRIKIEEWINELY
jgi:hypothetical protein